MLSGEEAVLTSISATLLVVCGPRRKAMEPFTDYPLRSCEETVLIYKFKRRSVDVPSPSPETCRSPKIVDRDESRRSLRVAFQYSSTANTSSSTRSTPHFASRRILNTTATGQVNISALITDSQCSRNQCFQSLDSIRSSLVFMYGDVCIPIKGRTEGLRLSVASISTLSSYYVAERFCMIQQ
jgi:hypothetical protein